LRPDVACGRDGCWVVWEDFRNGNWDIYAQKVTAAGALAGDNIRVTPNSAWQRNPAITANPESTGCELASYMVVWDDSRNAPAGAGTDIYAQQLGDARLCGDNRPVYTGAADQSYPDIAYGTGNNLYQVVWEDARNASRDVYARMINAGAGVVGASFAVAREDTSSQSRPHLAYDAEFGNEFTTVWNDQRTGGPDVFEQRTSGTGIRIGGNTAVAATALNESDAAVAFGDVSNHYLVVFVRGTEGVKSRAVWR
jgi:hypothetical protein